MRKIVDLSQVWADVRLKEMLLILGRYSLLQVVYDTSDFLDTNRDVIPDDIVSVFSRDNCQFGFATHLFGNEIKALAQQPATMAATNPRGISFRISPTSNATNPENQLLNGEEPVSTLTQDFHTRLDNLLRTLVHAKPHFVRCIRPNEHDSLIEFDRAHVAQQIRSLQILETVNLMAKGFPHRMRFKAFNARCHVWKRSLLRIAKLFSTATAERSKNKLTKTNSPEPEVAIIKTGLTAGSTSFSVKGLASSLSGCERADGKSLRRKSRRCGEAGMREEVTSLQSVLCHPLHLLRYYISRQPSTSR